MKKKLTYQELEQEIKILQEKLSRKASDEATNRINQQRLQSLWKLSSMIGSDFKNIYDTLLKEIVVVSESRYGFYGFLNKDESQMELYFWSHDVLDACSAQPKPLIYSIEKSGIWGNAVRERKPVIYNDYNMALPYKRGMPDGHVPLTRVLSIPVFSNQGKIVAIGCVANKKEDYNAGDIHQLVAYLKNAHLILENRKAEEGRKVLLEKALSELKILRGILPLCSFCKKIRNDDGYWESVDIYISKYSQADISHSICPDCLQKHYEDEYQKNIDDKKDKPE